jgi:predicted AlkP superfamily pyrophosphatase or phosphodiesterase
MDSGRTFILILRGRPFESASIDGRGALCEGVNSVFPSMTYPSHTTMVTGVQPAVHGIYYNTGPGEKVYWNDSSIKSPTLWAAAEQKGMVVAALLWPVSADAPVQYDIPDIGSLGETVREQYSKPAGFVDEVKKMFLQERRR